MISFNTGKYLDQLSEEELKRVVNEADDLEIRLSNDVNTLRARDLLFQSFLLGEDIGNLINADFLKYEFSLKMDNCEEERATIYDDVDEDIEITKEYISSEWLNILNRLKLGLDKSIENGEFTVKAERYKYEDGEFIRAELEQDLFKFNYKKDTWVLE